MKANSGPYMTVGQWVGTLVISTIPVVGIIANLIWLFGGGKRQERINFVRACLVWAIIVAVLCAIAVVILLFAFNMTFDQIFSEVAGAIQGEATAA